jgi:hypothetical protein
MPSDYAKICSDNLEEYGKGTRHLSFLDRLYSERTHFIFEGASGFGVDPRGGHSMAARHPEGRDREPPCRTSNSIGNCWG